MEKIAENSDKNDRQHFSQLSNSNWKAIHVNRITNFQCKNAV